MHCMPRSFYWVMIFTFKKDPTRRTIVFHSQNSGSMHDDFCWHVLCQIILQNLCFISVALLNFRLKASISIGYHSGADFIRIVCKAWFIPAFWFFCEVPLFLDCVWGRPSWDYHSKYTEIIKAICWCITRQLAFQDLSFHSFVLHNLIKLCIIAHTTPTLIWPHLWSPAPPERPEMGGGDI